MPLINAASMPAPRLELRWHKSGKTWRSLQRCDYLLVIPLHDSDIRRDQNSHEGTPPEWRSTLVVPLGQTQAHAGTCPMWEGSIRTPFRDSQHAIWDSAALKGMPVYAVCEGKAMLVTQ